MKKKATKKKKEKIAYYLAFSGILYDDDCKEYRSVTLNNKEIYRLSQERFMGHLKDQSKEVCAAISKELGIEFTKGDLDSARRDGFFKA